MGRIRGVLRRHFFAALAVTAFLAGLGAQTALGAPRKAGAGACGNTDCYGPNLCQFKFGVWCTLEVGRCTVYACQRV